MKSLIRNTGPFKVLLLTVCMCQPCEASFSPSPLAGSPTPSSISPAHSDALVPTENVKLTSDEAKRMLLEFLQAQRTEIKALEHRYRFESKELKASQAARRKEWDKKEQEARHRFFADHASGSERRTYVQDFIRRRDLFYKMLTDEKNAQAHEQDNRLAAVHQDQINKLQEFKKVSQEGNRPSLSLWPKAGN